MRTWTPTPVRWKSCLSWRTRTRLQVSAMRPGRRTFARWKQRAPRVAPSRAKSAAEEDAAGENAAHRYCELSRQSRRRWQDWNDGRARHRQTAGYLAVDDVLVDSMRGRSSTWTRIRVNLRHVPEEMRPAQETPDPDDDPTREWRQWRKKKSATEEYKRLSRRLSDLRRKIAASSCGGTTSSWA